MIFDNENLLIESPLSSKLIDCLFINSKPMSWYNTYPDKDYDDLYLQLLSENKLVCTTDKTKYKEILCARDYGLNLIEIGNISIGVKKIYSLDTGPLHYCFNIWNIDSISEWVIFCNLPLMWDYNDRSKTYLSIRNYLDGDPPVKI